MTLEAKAHINFAIEGDKVDEVDFRKILSEAVSDLDCEVVNGHVTIYYSKKQEEKKK